MAEPSTECSLLLARERKTKVICAELNNFTDLKSTLGSVIHHIRELTGCQALSIRLHNTGDYTYLVYDGFPESHIKKENSLCSRDECGNPVVSADGSCQLECLCGHVIDGRFDSKLPFFTPYGSFWTNNSPSLTSRIKDDFQVSILRGHCFSAGYQSMALIPIKQQGKRVGLIQINDFKAGAFTENLIEYLETIASQIGLAVRNSMIHTNLKEREQELEQAQQELLTSNRRPSLFHLQT